MDFLDLEVNKEVYIFNKLENTVVKALVISVSNYVPIDLGEDIIEHNIYRKIEFLIYNSAGKYIRGFGVSNRERPISFSIDNFDNSLNERFNKEYEIYSFYCTFEDFKKDIDGIIKNYEITEINSLQKKFEQDKRDIEKKATELKAKLLNIGK